MKPADINIPTLEAFLAVSPVIDWAHESIRVLAIELSRDCSTTHEIVRQSFEWVRDQIQHSGDFRRGPVTCAASEVLESRTGFCYAKSHLLAALLRANSIPAGLCYQRLSVNGDGVPFCLHGFNAVYLAEIGWYRIDPRGNRAGIDAQFCPPQERLAFTATKPGETDLPGVYAEPLPEVIHALHAHGSWETLCENLPDLRDSS
jgi:transglutaminase-like putative cysteine protease